MGGVDAACVQKGLQLLERHHTVDGSTGLFQPVLQLLGGTRSDEDDLRRGVGTFDQTCRFHHGRHRTGDVLRQFREILLHEGDERRTTRRGEQFLLLPLLGLAVKRDVRAEGGLHHVMES